MEIIYTKRSILSNSLKKLGAVGAFYYCFTARLRSSSIVNALAAPSAVHVRGLSTR